MDFLSSPLSSALVLIGVLAVGIPLSRACYRSPALALALLLPALVAGELWRPVLPAIGEVALLDVVVVAVGGLVLLRAARDRTPWASGPSIVAFCCFLIVAGLSLALAASGRPLSEGLVAASYLARLSSYGLLYFAAYRSAIPAKALVLSTASLALVLALLGFVQLYLVPDFSFMARWGWDPHQGRLLSTWFDPNFLGGFFAVVMGVTANALLRPGWSPRLRVFLLSALVIILAALFLTYSRSAYLATAVVLGLTGLRYSRKATLIAALVVIIATAVVPRARERVLDMASGAASLVARGYEYGMDETARLRVQSWEQGLSVFRSAPWLGVGYNALRFVKAEEGYVTRQDVHSAGGWDSSLLTILSTTGILGFLCYVAYLVAALLAAFRPRPGIAGGMSLGFGIALIGLLVHAFFVNSLLLPAFLATQFVFLGIIERDPVVPEKQHKTS